MLEGEWCRTAYDPRLLIARGTHAHDAAQSAANILLLFTSLIFFARSMIRQVAHLPVASSAAVG